MKKNHNDIFPPEILESTTSYYFKRYDSKSIILYQVVLVLLISIFVGIFVIKVDVNVQGVGMIKSVENRNQLRSIVTGSIDSVFVSENSRIKKGQKIFSVKTNILDEKSESTKRLVKEYQSQMSDLNFLISKTNKYDWENIPRLSNPNFQQEANFFFQKLNDIKEQFELAKKEFKRSELLFQSGAIAEAEFDRSKQAYERAKNTVLASYSQQAAYWQANLNQIRLLFQDLQSKNVQIDEEIKFYSVESPIDGYIQDIRQLYPGASVAAGETLAEITPDGALIAEVYVQPKDIGFINPNTPVKFQVDAFNYNEWGFLEGKIESISNDVFIQPDGKPYFKIRCELPKEEMKLKNGYTGQLLKGMTVQARFSFTRRRIINLLFDKVDDWVNPNLANK
ncbi:HlyD family secretion protein [Belliella kenyensis]|uniref:HlyD family secretion protein n=1 Tax=Belliella kenyensis TaxID=1472724 RepID=A0ABV8EFF4_9BACT|nr:HlyD family efflux transporter periplasmic adaptor subunit [Belliella kenyensis]MCH7401173.1 HlyD family secretion protein [Belliella kenyensis]MDN3604170.1 HlyD family efflux transporter periplasmic adaptor subunit [Belliella kenyensis]